MQKWGGSRLITRIIELLLHFTCSPAERAATSRQRLLFPVIKSTTERPASGMCPVIMGLAGWCVFLLLLLFSLFKYHTRQMYF